MSVARAVQNFSFHPDFGRAAAVKIHGLGTIQLGEEVCKFPKGHAVRKARLATVDGDEKEFFVVPAEGRTGMAVVRLADAGGLSLAIAHKGRSAAEAGLDTCQAGSGFRRDRDDVADFCLRCAAGKASERKDERIFIELGISAFDDVANARPKFFTGSEREPLIAGFFEDELDAAGSFGGARQIYRPKTGLHLLSGRLGIRFQFIRLL